MLKICILIPIYNRLEVTKKGIASLKMSLERYYATHEPHIKFDIIVVDDNSTDGSPEWIKAAHPDVVVLHGNGNLWWTGSIDLGARFAVHSQHCSHILLWNDDLECDKDYFANLGSILEQNRELRSSILVSKIYWSDTRDVLFNFGCLFNSKTGKKTLIGSNERDGEKYNKLTEVDWSGGMGTLIPADTLLKINFFDPINFPQYHGDSDMFLRAKQQGYKVFAVPSLKLFNDRNTTGVKQIKKFADLKAFFTSNRSNYNLAQNIEFTKRHCTSIIAWPYLVKTYMKVLLISMRNFT
ncbi:MAG: glycosyltransferase family 2 protein [Dyadobacter sp.]|uniref:glycosyltransferase family 2 protein n=1 Tax=Dyadobacter sp. TaxID=1914288 RepID=UPI0032663075